jgi:hypothetical protein
MRLRWTKLAAPSLAVLLAMGATACGDDDDDINVEDVSEDISEGVQDVSGDVSEGVEDVSSEVEQQVDEGEEEGGRSSGGYG